MQNQVARAAEEIEADIESKTFMELSTSQKRKVASSTKRHTESQPKDGVMKAAKGRFYVIRRCIVMLLCWKENEDK